MPFRLGRGLRISAGRTRTYGVLASGGLYEHIRSHDTAFLHDMLNREFCTAPAVEFSDDCAFQRRSPVIVAEDSNRSAARLVPMGTRIAQQIGSILWSAMLSEII